MSAAGSDTTPVISRFRPDIQGLRAVAVVLVLAFHLLPWALPGGFVGVDVFFVVSGFLITGLLVQELETTGRIAFARFYVRRIKRLMPAATLVLVAVALATIYTLPIIRWKDTAYQVLASAAYVENWLLVRNAVDYWAEDAAPSPVTHYWSLSIEEQFYLVWPCLLALVGLLAAKAKLRLRAGLAVAVALIFAVSLLYSVRFSYSDGAAAYFSTWTRAWELALGALTWLGRDWLRAKLSSGVVGSLGWLGFLGVGASAFSIRESMAFPGWVALLPTLGCTLLLLAGPGASKFSPSRLLASRPLQFLGDISYPLYLWHWPLIVLFSVEAERSPRLVDAGLLALAALGLALSTHVLVENPLRRSSLGSERSAAGFALGSACVLVSLLAVKVPLAKISEIERTAGGSGEAKGALAFLELKQQQSPQVGAGAATIVPAPLDAKDDVPILVEQGCHLNVKAEEPKVCDFGSQDAPTRVVLMGDSHAAQWLPALLALANQYHLRVTTITKTSCPLTDDLVNVGKKKARPYDECREWNRRLPPLLAQLRPALVITSQASSYNVVGATSPEESERRLAAGLTRSWDSFARAGLPVLGIRDTPEMGFDVADCVARNLQNLALCSLPRAEALDGSDPALRAVKDAEEALIADLSDFICARETCPAAVGGVLVYRDAHHLTATYAKTLAPLLWPHIEEALQL